MVISTQLYSTSRRNLEKYLTPVGHLFSLGFPQGSVSPQEVSGYCNSTRLLGAEREGHFLTFDARLGSEGVGPVRAGDIYF